MKTTHTPGPWTLDPDNFVIAELDFGRQIIADPNCGIRIRDWSEEHRANARLIAAAPELLEALEIFVRPDRQLEKTPGGWYIFRLTGADVNQVAAAITKAKGE